MCIGHVHIISEEMFEFFAHFLIGLSIFELSEFFILDTSPFSLSGHCFEAKGFNFEVQRVSSLWLLVHWCHV